MNKYLQFLDILTTHHSFYFMPGNELQLHSSIKYLQSCNLLNTKIGRIRMVEDRSLGHSHTLKGKHNGGFAIP